MEADHILGLADTADGHGVMNEPHGPVSVKGRGDDAGLFRHLDELLAHLRLAHQHAVRLQLQRPAQHLRLVAADQNDVPVREHQVLPPGGQGNGHDAGDLLPQLRTFVEDLALQHGQQVVHRNVSHLRVPDRGHIVVRDISGGQHSVQGAVLIGHGHGGHLVLLHGLPGAADGGGGIQGGRRIVIQVPHLVSHIGDEHGRLETEAVQHALGLVADLAQPGSLILPLSQGVLQCGIGHGGHDGIRVRVTVAGDIDSFHE